MDYAEPAVARKGRKPKPSAQSVWMETHANRVATAADRANRSMNFLPFLPSFVDGVVQSLGIEVDHVEFDWPG